MLKLPLTYEAIWLDPVNNWACKLAENCEPSPLMDVTSILWNEADEILRLRSNLNKILAKNTKQTLKKIETDTDRNFFMSSLEAKKYGLIDAVLNERK